MNDSIFTYTEPGDYPQYLSIFRDHGELFVTVRGPRQHKTSEFSGYDCSGEVVTIKVPEAEIIKMIAAFAAKGPWPGCDCGIKQAQAEVGKPNGGPLS